MTIFTLRVKRFNGPVRVFFTMINDSSLASHPNSEEHLKQFSNDELVKSLLEAVRIQQ